MSQPNRKELREELARLKARVAEIEVALNRSSLASALVYPNYNDPIRLHVDGSATGGYAPSYAAWSQGNIFPDRQSAHAESKCREIMTKLRRLARASRERNPDAVGVIDVPVATTIAFATRDDAEEAIDLIGEDNLRFLADHW